MPLNINFDSVKKKDLVNKEGVSYTDFREKLTPKYHRVWMDLLAGHFFLLLISSLIILLQYRYPSWAFLSILPGAFLLGFIVAYIHLFSHEAAHYNLAKSRRWNDALSNIFIGVILGLDIKKYRLIHFAHHRYLGTVSDTERSYFDALTLRFIIESLTGIKALKVVLNRRKTIQSQPSGGTRSVPDDRSSSKGISITLFNGIVFNSLIIALSFYYGYWMFAMAWIIGIASIFPFFAALRNVLEHRDEFAKNETDYSAVSHGETNRLFGSGLLANTMGGAGFNRHLLHHWDPQISYTRLSEVEKFILNTSYSNILEKQNTTYFKTFFKLFQF